MPDVPMFGANPAKRPRRETLTDTLTTVDNTIVSALKPGASTSNETAAVPVDQVFRFINSSLLPVCISVET